MELSQGLNATLQSSDTKDLVKENEELRRMAEGLQIAAEDATRSVAVALLMGCVVAAHFSAEYPSNAFGPNYGLRECQSFDVCVYVSLTVLH